MNIKLELVMVPVGVVDKAIDFYTSIGFNKDQDHKISEEVRFVQLTPPGSACSIAIGKGLTQMTPGSMDGLQVVVEDIHEARQHLLDAGLDIAEVETLPWGSFVYFADPDGNRWSVQQLPARA